MSAKPSIYVLAGVNGAGKSSIGGRFLEQAGLSWYNPDSLARALVQHGLAPLQANAFAWQEGMAQLDSAVSALEPFAFETTLGGKTVFEKLKAACSSHAVRIWYCGLGSPEQHIARVQYRVARGGHDIPEEKIRERWEQSRINLINLMPFLAELGVFDNSATAQDGEPIPEPKLILHLLNHRSNSPETELLYPDAVAAMTDAPEWSHPILERALQLAG